MTRKPGTLEYRCRRCGEVFDGAHSPCVLITTMEMLVFGKSKTFTGVPPTERHTHRCPDGGEGVGDLIGGRADDAKPKPTTAVATTVVAAHREIVLDTEAIVEWLTDEMEEPTHLKTELGRTLLGEVKRLKWNAEHQIYKGNSIDHWWAKAQAYGGMVHGCAPALRAAGYPVDASGELGAVGGIRRAVEALTAENEMLRAENDQAIVEAKLLGPAAGLVGDFLSPQQTMYMVRKALLRRRQAEDGDAEGKSQKPAPLVPVVRAESDTSPVSKHPHRAEDEDPS